MPYSLWRPTCGVVAWGVWGRRWRTCVLHTEVVAQVFDEFLPLVRRLFDRYACASVVAVSRLRCGGRCVPHCVRRLVVCSTQAPEHRAVDDDGGVPDVLPGEPPADAAGHASRGVLLWLVLWPCVTRVRWESPVLPLLVRCAVLCGRLVVAWK